MEDVVVEAPWCAACRRSSDRKWKKHVFTHKHQHAARQFLLAELSRLQMLAQAQAEAEAEATASTQRWWCVFCEANSPEQQQAVEHFASVAHRKRVEAFCRLHKCDQDRQLRVQLVLSPERRRKLLSVLAQREAEKKQKTEVEEAQRRKEDSSSQEIQAAGPAEAFLASAALRLEQVQAAQQSTDRSSQPQELEDLRRGQEALLGPQLAPMGGTRRFKTLTSPAGVTQHPLGQHDGQRVWGGGIVKLKKAEWLPWAIDWLVKDELAQHATVSLDGGDGHGFQETADAFSHRVTEQAYGQGLGSIASVSWRGSVGNVHTAAVPPWMVHSEDEYKQCNRREQPPPTKQHATEPQHDTRTRRDIFSVLEEEKSYGPDWLPNFGGVWQEGPRSRTKQAFRKTAKPVRDRAAGQSSGVSTVQPHTQAKLHPEHPKLPFQPRMTRLARPTASPASTTRGCGRRAEPSMEPTASSSAGTTAAVTLRTQPQAPQDRASRHLCSVPVDGTEEKNRHSRDKQTQSPLPPAAPTPAATTPTTVTSTTSTDAVVVNPLDAKKQLLAAQKERLRAKMAARRKR